MPITGGFGTTYDTRTGASRAWYLGRDGVKRWADNHEPVERQQPADASDGERPDA